jgi:hypothetical protein
VLELLWLMLTTILARVRSRRDLVLENLFGFSDISVGLEAEDRL